jgi:secondary thiamine-phosphate synthase enzyme
MIYSAIAPQKNSGTISSCSGLENAYASASGEIAVLTLRVKTDRRTQFVDITSKIESLVSSAAVNSGICHIYVPHTTAAVTVNEHADPDVAADVEAFLDRLVPHRGPYKHSEGNSDAHAKALLVGASQTIFIEDGKLALGRWQGIFFCEFDGPRDRRVYAKVVSDAGK